MFDFFSKQKRWWRYCNIFSSASNRFSRKTKFFILAGALIILNPLQACANQQMIGMDQNDTTIKLKVNEVLQIELPGNAGTGFEWRFKKLDDKLFVLLGSHKKIFEKDDPNYVGNAYLKSWSVKAIKAGSSDVRLLYYRAWEGEEMAEKSLSVKVVIDP